MKLLFASVLLTVLIIASSFAVTITNLSVKCTPAIVQINLPETAVATISGTGTGQISYKWENGDGNQFHSTKTLQIDFNGNDLKIPVDTNWLWTSELGNWDVKFRIVSPDSMFAEDNYEVVTNPFHITNSNLNCIPSLQLVNRQVTAMANISGTGYGVINYYWENRLNGNFHSSKPREAVFNLKDIIIQTDTAWLNTSEIGTGQVTLYITSPDTITLQAIYRVGLSEVTSESGNENFTLSPNPATDELEISYSPSIKSGLVEVYNVFGIKIPPRLTSSATPQEGNLRLDVSLLPPGVYFVKVGEKLGKFVKM